jgi:hypothetical protein
MGVPGGECWGGCRSVLARVGYAYCYEASYAYAPSPRRLLPSHLHSVYRLALVCERACGMSFTCRHQRGCQAMYPLGEAQ